jgi:hypothetical protein
METAQKIAVRYQRTGTLVASVTIAEVGDREHLVVVTSPWAGAGSAIGYWPTGFVGGDLATHDQRDYFCAKFGINAAVLSRKAFAYINRLYLAALEEVTRGG